MAADDNTGGPPLATTRRAALVASMAALLPVLPAGLPLGAVPALAAVEPDAELAAACHRLLGAIRTYNAHGGRVECDVDPLWHAVGAAEDAMDALPPPVTLRGVMAKARLANQLAQEGPSEYEEWDGRPYEIAADVVQDLLRLLPEVRS